MFVLYCTPYPGYKAGLTGCASGHSGNGSSSIEDSGGFWARHPSWDDRIANIKAP
ncbi:MAG: hypothetical protein Q7J27_00670 [Syntrophales bacterium]|nr:hypothetical protein [Syntrophales bacterium]